MFSLDFWTSPHTFKFHANAHTHRSARDTHVVVSLLWGAKTEEKEERLGSNRPGKAQEENPDLQAFTEETPRGR